MLNADQSTIPEQEILIFPHLLGGTYAGWAEVVKFTYFQVPGHGCSICPIRARMCSRIAVDHSPFLSPSNVRKV